MYFLINCVTTVLGSIYVDYSTHRFQVNALGKENLLILERKYPESTLEELKTGVGKHKLFKVIPFVNFVISFSSFVGTYLNKDNMEDYLSENFEFRKFTNFEKKVYDANPSFKTIMNLKNIRMESFGDAIHLDFNDGKSVVVLKYSELSKKYVVVDGTDDAFLLSDEEIEEFLPQFENYCLYVDDMFDEYANDVVQKRVADDTLEMSSEVISQNEMESTENLVRTRKKNNDQK